VASVSPTRAVINGRKRQESSPLIPVGELRAVETYSSSAKTAVTDAEEIKARN
jgi:hypothetical protein